MTFDHKPLNVGGLLPYEAFICDPPDYFIANEKAMEMTELLKKALTVPQVYCTNGPEKTSCKNCGVSLRGHYRCEYCGTVNK